MLSTGGDASFYSHDYTPRECLMFLAILPWTEAGVFILRLRALDFLARIWLPKARSRMSLPEPEILIRLAVPLCVFSLGIMVPFVKVSIVGKCNQWAVEVGITSSVPGLIDYVRQSSAYLRR